MIDAETSQADDDTKIKSVVHVVTRAGNHYLPDPPPTNQVTSRQPTPKSRQRNGNRHPRGGKSQTLPKPLDPPANDPSFVFRPSRSNTQCKACKKWVHSSNNCFMMIQIFWIIELIQLYQGFCKAIVDQYTVFHSRGQQAAQVCLLYRVNAIDSKYSEEELLNSLEVYDEYVYTNLVEPTTQRNDIQNKII